jgi:membrane fusion protein, multidrug efflux system
MLRFACAVPAALALLTACGGSAPVTPASQRGGARAAPVTVAPVERKPMVQVIEGTGSLEAYQVVVVAARGDGIVEEAAFEEGDDVDPKRTLAVVDGRRRKLEHEQAEAAVREAEAEGPRTKAAVERAVAGMERARAQEGAARTDLEEAQAVLQRREGLARTSPGVVPEEEIATKRAQVDRMRDALAVSAAELKEADGARAEAEAQAAVAGATLATAQARERIAALTLADAIVRPPISGTVRRRHVNLGQYVRAGDPVAEIVDRSRLRVRFRVTEAESVRLAKDMAFTFLVPSLSGARHPAQLVHVDETASSVSRMVECLGDVSEPDALLKPGFFVVARVETRPRDAVAVPESALLPSDQGWLAYVVEGGNAKQRRLTVGLRTREGLVEVIEGLKPDESLVVSGANVLSDGMAVKATPAAPLPPAAPPAPLR